MGLDPAVCTLFVQSHVPEHPRLTWLLECTATYGELRRMTQFKEKGGEQETVRAGLFTYPVLMAADILLYDAERVPVGDDQRQHLELTRDVAIRFNHRYGDTFVVPDAAVPKVGARVMDLQEPTRKMSKSVSSPLGTVLVLDPPEEIDRKVRKAVTDTESEVRYDPAHKAGRVEPAWSCLAPPTGGRPEPSWPAGYANYGVLKADVSEALGGAVAARARPLRRAHRRPGPRARRCSPTGAAKAQAVAGPTLDARHARPPGSWLRRGRLQRRDGGVAPAAYGVSAAKSPYSKALPSNVL